MSTMRAAWGIALGLLLLLTSPAAAEPQPPEPEAPAPEPAEPWAVVGELSLAPGPRLIPWERLDEEAVVLAREVVGEAVVFREVDGIAFRSRPEVYDFLIRHMDFAADVARTLREGRYRVRRIGEGYEADDGHGAHGFLRALYADDGRRIFFLQGRYDPPLLPSIAGRLVLVLETRHTDAPDGATYAEMRVTGYLRVDNAMAEVVAAVARSFSEAAVERKVKRFFRHVARVSRRAYDDPEGLAELLDRQGQLDPDRVAEFRRVLLAHRPPPWAESLPYRLWGPLEQP